MNRKGISPIIASVLLLAVSLAVVGIFSGWAPQLAQEITSQTSETATDTLNCNEASLEIRSAYYNGGSATVAIRNSGSQNLTDITLAAFDSSDTILGQNTSISIDAGNLSEETVTSQDDGTDTEPSYIEAYSSECSSVTASTEDITTG